MKVLIIMLGVIVIFVVLRLLFPLIQVVGDSMYPTYLNGEVIFGTILYRKSNLKNGDVIIYKCPTDDRIVIKRIDHIIVNNNEPYFYCLGDNLDQSYDSRAYGYFSSDRLVCKVINQRRNMNYGHDNNLCN